MVVCRLIAQDRAHGFNVPRLEISDREVVYESPVLFTPIRNRQIDEGAISEYLKTQYELAGVKPEDIRCGAIIVTGESAKIANAETTIESLSNFAGDFVSQVAGPKLESILAAKGSGASEFSRESQKCICNVDIGGGTTNVAIYHSGKLIATSCFEIGGRIIQLGNKKKVIQVSDSGQYFAKYLGLDIEPGKFLDDKILSDLVEGVADAFFDCLNLSDIHKSIFLTDLEQTDYGIDEYWFSGGVASLMEESGDASSCFGDLGAQLAEAILSRLKSRKVNFRIVESPIRATVIGAGSHTVQLSGHTVYVPLEPLPIKNVPLFKCPEIGKTQNLDSYFKEHTKLLEEFLVTREEKNIALLFPEIELKTYKQIKELCEVIHRQLNGLEVLETVVLILQSDAAMALGQQLKLQASALQFVVLDGIKIEDGDYIEVGKPISSGLTIPVTVKTLIFP